MAVLLGPVLIAGCVLFALRGFAFGSGLTNQHPDLLTFWLPRWSFLGDSIAAGRIPLWNPFEMAGYRFAADPQSGWLYAAPSALFSTLSPGLALRLFIVFNPALAGIGVYAFLRRESVGRAAATAGGLVLAMLGTAAVWAWLAPADVRGHATLVNAALVAYFALASALVVFATTYLGPRLA